MSYYRRFTRKPDGAVLNLGHISARGLVVACLTDDPTTSVRNLVNNARATPTGSSLRNTTGRFGRGMQNPDGGASYYDVTSNLTSDFTIISFQSCGTGVYQNVLDDDPVSSNRAFQYRIDNTDHPEFIRFDNAGNPYFATHTAALTSTQREGFQMAATSSGTNLAVWLDDVKVTGTLTGTPQTPNATTRALQIKGGSTYLDGLLYYWYAWNRKLSDDEIINIFKDPYGLIWTPKKRIYSSVPAGGSGATVNLSGVSATGSAGTFTITGSSVVNVTGVSATGSAGTITVSTASGATVNLTGVSATGSAGTFTITGGATVTLSGVSSTGSVGTLTINTGGNVTANLSGVSATGSAGTITITGTSTATLTGVSATGSAGTITVGEPVIWTRVTSSTDVWTLTNTSSDTWTIE